jgi:hypothetical protein
VRRPKLAATDAEPAAMPLRALANDSIAANMNVSRWNLASGSIVAPATK